MLFRQLNVQPFLKNLHLPHFLRYRAICRRSLKIEKKGKVRRYRLGNRIDSIPCTVRKLIKFPRYNMKGSGKHDTTVHELFRVVSGFPHHVSFYIAKNRIPLGQCAALALLYQDELNNRMN